MYIDDSQKESLQYFTANSLLINLTPDVFSKSILRRTQNTTLYFNMYDYCTSQLGMFLLKDVYNDERDLNSYMYAKEFLESFINTETLGNLDYMVFNFKKVFSWFLQDLTILRFKALAQNDTGFYLDIVPTVPKVMWDQSGSEGLRGKTLLFDFKEEALTELQSKEYNCIVISNKIIDEFVELCHKGDINLVRFVIKVLLDKYSNMDEWYDIEEICSAIMQTEDKQKQKLYAVSVIYAYLLEVKLHCIIDQR